MPVSNQEIENKDLNEIPRYQESLSGLGYIQRLAGKRDVRQLLLKIGETRDIEIELTSSGPSFAGQTTIKHNQGVPPYVMGDLQINGTYFPIPFVDSTGSFFFTFLTINESEITVSLRFFQAGTAKIKLYILREQID